MRIFHAYSITVIKIPKNSYTLGNTENINAIMTSTEYIPKATKKKKNMPTMLERNMYPLLGDMG